MTRASSRRRAGVWAGSIGFGVLAGLLVGLGLIVDPLWTWIFYIAAIGAFVMALIQGTLVYMHQIDEHERHANLRAAYVGLTVYIGLHVIQTLAGIFSYSPPWGQHAIFGIVCLVTTAVFFCDRYR